jgi:peptide/nickel transport system substrate-binding protein
MVYLRASNVRRVVSLLMVAGGVALLAVAAYGRDARTSVREGGTFRIAQYQPITNLDPALVDPDSVALQLLDATCAHLMTYPDRQPPRGYRLIPEVATGYPRVSRDGRTYTFVLSRSYRFNTKAPVRPSAFAWAITRALRLAALDRQGLTPAPLLLDIVGAEEVADGRAQNVTGITVRGNRLVIRLLRRVPDFAARMTEVCAVPPGLPPDLEGRLTFAAAGPYYIAKHVRGRTIVLQRNRQYHGPRPHHVERIVVDEDAASYDDVLQRVRRGLADYGWAPPAYFRDGLVKRYGVNRSQFWVKPGFDLIHYVFNSRSPLFRNNPALRRAVSFAVNRAAVRHALVGGALRARLTDKYLPPAFPGFDNARIYPLKRPNLKRARALAKGHRRSGRAVLYTLDRPVPIAAAQVIARNLARIGLDVTVKPIDGVSYFPRLAKNPDEPWDLAFAAWAPSYFDPHAYLNELFDGRFIGVTNLGRFDVRKYNRMLRHAAGGRGKSRYQAYGALDVRLARDAAPSVAIQFNNVLTLVSRRVDKRCIVLRPYFDLAAVCLKP